MNKFFDSQGVSYCEGLGRGNGGERCGFSVKIIYSTSRFSFWAEYRWRLWMFCVSCKEWIYINLHFDDDGFTANKENWKYQSERRVAPAESRKREEKGLLHSERASESWTSLSGTSCFRDLTNANQVKAETHQGIDLMDVLHSNQFLLEGNRHVRLHRQSEAIHFPNLRI